MKKIKEFLAKEMETVANSELTKAIKNALELLGGKNEDLPERLPIISYKDSNNIRLVYGRTVNKITGFNLSYVTPLVIFLIKYNKDKDAYIIEDVKDLEDPFRNDYLRKTQTVDDYVIRETYSIPIMEDFDLGVTFYEVKDEKEKRIIPTFLIKEDYLINKYNQDDDTKTREKINQGEPK